MYTADNEIQMINRALYDKYPAISPDDPWADMSVPLAEDQDIIAMNHRPRLVIIDDVLYARMSDPLSADGVREMCATGKPAVLVIARCVRRGGKGYSVQTRAFSYTVRNRDYTCGIQVGALSCHDLPFLPAFHVFTSGRIRDMRINRDSSKAAGTGPFCNVTQADRLTTYACAAGDPLCRLRTALERAGGVGKYDRVRVLVDLLCDLSESLMLYYNHAWAGGTGAPLLQSVHSLRIDGIRCVEMLREVFPVEGNDKFGANLPALVDMVANALAGLGKIEREVCARLDSHDTDQDD